MMSVCLAGAEDVLVLDENGRGATGRFRVLDHEGEALGLMVSAEDKFVAAASTAKVEINSVRIRVTIDCPVPVGMAVEKHTSSAWSGDGVELFIRPSLDSTVYYQYSANAANVFAARRNTAPDVMDANWRTAARSESAPYQGTNGFSVTFEIPVGEVFKVPLKPGDVFGINFTRCGKTCSGMSTWAAVGSKFSNIDAFGRAIFGGTKAYFARRLADANGRAGSPLPAASSLAGMLEKVTESVKERGGDPAQFSAIEKMFADVDKAIISASLAGKSILMFRPEVVWGNRIAPSEKSRPLEAIRMCAARNSRAVAVFAVANLADRPFVGQMRVTDAKPAKAKKLAQKILEGRVSVSQGFVLADRVGRALYDPILPLPMNSLLRLAPKETVPMYLELDTHGLAAGTYRATLSLKKAMPGFTDESVAVEVEVVDADLDEVAVDRAGYDYVGHSYGAASPPDNIAKLLVDRGYNVIFMATMWMFPREREDGSFSVKDLSRINKRIDAAIAGGLSPKRVKLWLYMGMEPSHPWNTPKDVQGMRCPFGSEKWKKGVQSMVQEIAMHVKTRYGIGKDRIYWYPIDEPFGDIDDPTFKSSISRAYHAAKVIKEEDSANLTMTDPLPKFLESKAINTALPRLAEVYDVIELYRASVTDEKRRLVAAQNLKEVWTYSILTKETHPAKYRRDYWENMRDGYREITTFWHMDQVAGSPFDSNDFTTPGRYDDYASLYVDFANDAALLSRRQLAADMGFEETRLILWLRKRFRGDSAMLAKVDAIVKGAADKGTMSEMDSAYDSLLALVPPLAPSRP